MRQLAGGEHGFRRMQVQEVVALQPVRHRHRGLFDVALHFAQRARPALAVMHRAATSERFAGLAQSAGQAPVVFKQFVLGVTGIAGEQLITAIAGQHHRNAIFAGKASAEIGRQRAGIAKRFVAAGGNARQRIERFIRLQFQLEMFGVEVLG